MTDDIIRMAREAGVHAEYTPGMIPLLERFAALVAEKERASMMQLFTDPENQPTQHGTVTVEYMQREIDDERKACAKAGWLAASSDCDDEVFEAIMARGQA